MKATRTGLTVAVILAVLAGTLQAGVWEQKAAINREAKWAAGQVATELPASSKVKDHAVTHIGILVGPRGPFVKLFHVPVSDALAGVEGITEVWPKDDITEFVDLAYLHPKEPRYSKDTILTLGGKFKAAGALLFISHDVEEPKPGKIQITTSLSLWDAKTAEKLWGSNQTQLYDYQALAEISRLINAGEIEEAAARIPAALREHVGVVLLAQLLREAPQVHPAVLVRGQRPHLHPDRPVCRSRLPRGWRIGSAER